MKKAVLIIFFFSSLYSNECPPIRTNQRDIALQPDTASDELVQAFGYSAANNNQTNRLEKQLISESCPLLVELTIWKRFAKEVKAKNNTAIPQLPYGYYQIDNFMLCIPEKWRTQYPQTGFNLSATLLIEKPFEIVPKLHDPLIGFGKTALMLANIYESMVKTLKKLMVHEKTRDFSWNVLLFGHGGPLFGSYTDRVGGLPSTEFKKLLQFMNNNITTNIFLYQTCYAGSKWLLRFYQTGGKPDRYNYAIILTGISEAPVYSWISHHPSIYQNFFQKIRKLSICPAQSHELITTAAVLLQAITPGKKDATYSLRRINNSVQVRWPESTKFKVVEIDSIIATAKGIKSKPQESVVVSATALVLDSTYLDKTIVLTPGQHAIASSLNKKVHYIKEFDLLESFANSEVLAKRIANFFVQVEKLSWSTSKLYLIETIADKNKTQQLHHVMIFINSSSPSTLPLFKTNELFYMHNDKGYLLDMKKGTIQELASLIAKKYSDLFEKEKNNLLAQRKK